MTDRVLVASTSSSARVYHTDRECRNLTDRAFERDRDVAEEWGFEECQICSGEFQPPGADQQTRTHLNALLAHAEADD